MQDLGGDGTRIKLYLGVKEMSKKTKGRVGSFIPFIHKSKSKRRNIDCMG